MCIEQWDVKVWTHIEECGFHLQEMAASRKELKFSKDDHDKFSLFQGSVRGGLDPLMHWHTLQSRIGFENRVWHEQDLFYNFQINR